MQVLIQIRRRLDLMKISVMKFLSVLLSFVFLVSFCACAGSSSDEGTEGSDEPYTGNTVENLPFEQGDASADGPDYQELYRQTYTSVVTITLTYSVRHAQGGVLGSVEREAYGTGFVVDSERGYIVTSSLLFEETAMDAECSVLFYSGEEVSAALCGYDTVSSLFPMSSAIACSDIAIVKLDEAAGAASVPDGVTEVQFADSGSLAYGAACYTIATLSAEGSFVPSVMDTNLISKPYNTHASVFNFNKYSNETLFDGSFDYLIMTGITLREGNAGAPLFDAQGRVIGMLNYRAEDTEIMRENDAYGISFATPSATIKAVLNDFYTKEGLDASFTVDTLVRGSIFSDLSVIEKADAGTTTGAAVLTEYFPDYYIADDDSSIVFAEGIYAEKTEGTTAERVASARVNSTVKIIHYIPSESGYSIGEGSGFLINTDGYFITNMHVVNSEVQDSNNLADFNKNVPQDLDSDCFYVLFENGTLTDGGAVKYVLLRAEVVAFDKTGDLALLRFVNEISHEENGEVVPGFSEDAVCAFRSETAFGESVVAIGNPEGYGIALAQGIVSNPACDYYESQVGYLHILTDCPINSGNSGGPLFNKDGEVVAVNTLGLNTEAYPGYGNVSWSICADAVTVFLDTANELSGARLPTDTIGSYAGNGRVYVMESRMPEGGIEYQKAG